MMLNIRKNVYLSLANSHKKTKMAESFRLITNLSMTMNKLTMTMNKLTMMTMKELTFSAA